MVRSFPSGIAADEVDGILVVGDVAVNDVVDRCPRCGGRGRIANGPAQEAATTVMLRSSEEAKDIQALILLLEEMRKRGLSRDQVADHIEEKAPRFTALKIFLPSNPGELYGFLGFLTGAAGILYAHYSAGKRAAEDAQLIREIASQMLEELRKPDPRYPSPTRESAKPSTSSAPGQPDLARLRSLLREGDEASIRGQFDKAVQHYSRALVENRDNHTVLVARADAYRRLNQFDLALQDVNRALQLEPKYVNAWRERGEIYYDQQRYDLALKDASRALALNSNDWAVLGLRAAIYNQLTRHRLAFLDANRALEHNPDYVRALVERASVHYAFERYDLALRDADRAVELEPNYASAWGVRGGIYRQMGQYKLALEDLDRALQLNPDYRWALRERREIS